MPFNSITVPFYASFLEAQKQIPEKAPLDTFVYQTAYFFESTPHVTFLSSPGQEAIRYKDLFEFDFTQEQQKFIIAEEKRLEEQAKIEGRPFYNGMHLAITGVDYDDESKKLMITAHRCSYVVLLCLSKGALSIPSDLSFYRAGVLSPFLTTDFHTAFMERNDKSKDTYDKNPRIFPKMKSNLFSVASGFLEPHEGLETLLSDIISTTGRQEATQEFAIPAITKTPPLCGVSIRKTTIHNAPGTVEFIVPIALPWNKDQLEQMLRNNTAKDAYEHTGKFQILSIADKVAFNTFRNQFPGSFLCNPCFQTLERYSDSLSSSIKEEMQSTPPIRFSSPSLRPPDQSTPNPPAALEKKKLCPS